MNKRFTKLFLLMVFSIPGYLFGQCNATPDASACYASGETNVVLFELTSDIATICSGSFETNWDDLTVYSGAPGSGTGGTIVFGPSDGDLSGTVINTSAAGETLIFVSNSDGSVSCASGSQTALEVFIGSCPTPPVVDFMPACGETAAYPACLDGYAANENVTFTVCPDAGGYVGITFTYVDIEASTATCPWDALSISTASGTEGPLCGEPDGDGGVGSGLAAGDCFHSIVPDNCITVTFTSDGSVQETGFEFVVSCVTGADLPTDACVGGGTALPVELLSFDGQAMEDENKLTWATASEENTEWHIIERSIDGRNNWTEIGKTRAAGTTSDLQQYELLDRAPVANAYYRVKSVDFDLYTQYSNVIQIARENAPGDINVYPNPVSQDLNIDFTLVKSEEVSFTITDMAGKQIAFETLEAARGLNNHSIDFNKLNSGVYFITMTSTSGIVTKRVVKN